MDRPYDRAWLCNKTAGRANIPAAIDSGQRREICRIEVPEADAQGWTVVLGAAGVAVDDPAMPLTQWDSYAEIEWGSAGEHFSVEVDWARGATIPVYGSFVRVSVVISFPQQCDYLMPFFQASIQPGVRRPVGCRRTVHLGDILDTNSLTWIVPAFAYQFQHFVYSATDANQHRLQFYSANTLRQEIRFVLGSAIRYLYGIDQVYRVPGSASRMQYTNVSGTTHTVTFVYDLAL